jgi:hypothetical protein
VRGEFRDNEVEEPLGGRGQADTIGSETSSVTNVSTGVTQSLRGFLTGRFRRRRPMELGPRMQSSR